MWGLFESANFVEKWRARNVKPFDGIWIQNRDISVGSVETTPEKNYCFSRAAGGANKKGGRVGNNTFTYIYILKRTRN